MSDWNNFGQWTDNGALTATQRANGIWKQILNDFEAPSMDPARVDARSQGKRLGRPPVPPIQIEKMKRMREKGMTLTAIAKKVGVSVGKVHQCV